MTTNVIFDATGVNGVILDASYTAKLLESLNFLLLNIGHLRYEEQKDAKAAAEQILKDLAHSANYDSFYLPAIK